MGMRIEPSMEHLPPFASLADADKLAQMLWYCDNVDALRKAPSFAWLLFDNDLDRAEAAFKELQKRGMAKADWPLS